MSEQVSAESGAGHDDKPECREEHGSSFYDTNRPTGGTGTHGTTGRVCWWDGSKWRIQAWDGLHWAVLEGFFEAYKQPDQRHGSRGERAGWSPDEIIAEHVRRYIEESERAALARVRHAAEQYARGAHVLGHVAEERRWLDILALIERTTPPTIPSPSAGASQGATEEGAGDE